MDEEVQIKEPMKTSGLRLGSLFRRVGLIDDPDWAGYFPQRASDTRLVDILLQDVSWQTFVDLARLEIRLPSRRRRSPARLPVELTQPLAVRPAEILHFMTHHRPDVPTLCRHIARVRPDLDSEISLLLEETETGEIDAHRALVERRILTPDTLLAIIEAGEHPLARRNREVLALEILRLNDLLAPEAYEAMQARLADPAFALAGSLAAHGGVASRQLAEAAAGGMVLPTVDLATAELDEACRACCPVDLVRRELVLPIASDPIARVAVSDPLNLSAPDLLAILSERPVLPCYAPTSEIIAAINRNFPPLAVPQREEPREADGVRPAAVALPGDAESKALRQAPPRRRVEPVAQIIDTTSTVELVSSLIESAVATQATDIHLEPYGDGLRVRFRIDGLLHNVMHIPESLTLPVISRIKVLANMNVTERRRPQDGHFALEIEGRGFDFRISAMPSHLGEKLVLRILDQSTVLRGLSELGLDPDHEGRLVRLVTRPHGLLLVTGPTGSGKTTTLYSALSTINAPEVNITTIEDPVEYQLEGITQMQVDYAIDLDFASGLRAALRQDPDVIMVGEIRDTDTARIAIRAALTGHLVLSTLHTNSAVRAVSALFHLGIQPYLISTALTGVVAQRLLRKLCLDCRQAIAQPEGLKRDLGLAPDAIIEMYRGEGCPSCLNTGYLGRTGVFEVFNANEELRRLIIQQAGDEAIEASARRFGFRTLREHALEKVAAGVTSPDEVLRAVYLD